MNVRRFALCLAFVAGMLSANQAFAGYAQYVEVKITNKGGATFSIRNAKVAWGKFHTPGNKDAEINAAVISQMKVAPGKVISISACGRDSAASGTEGSFDVYDGETKVGTYSWDCPYGKKTNKSEWSTDLDEATSPYAAGASGGSLDAGALGTITITLGKIAK